MSVHSSGFELKRSESERSSTQDDIPLSLEALRQLEELARAARRIRDYARRLDIGQPVDNGGGAAVRCWDGIIVQDFSGGADTKGRCMVIDGPRGPHLVRNDFYTKYLEGTHRRHLGAPTEGEHWEGDEVVQRFEHGMMVWSPSEGTRVTLYVGPFG